MSPVAGQGILYTKASFFSNRSRKMKNFLNFFSRIGERPILGAIKSKSRATAEMRSALPLLLLITFSSFLVGGDKQKGFLARPVAGQRTL